MLTFALVGVALLPALFFYLAFTIGQQHKPLRIAFICFALFSCMLITNELVVSYPTIKEPATWIHQGLIAFLILYMTIELLLFVLEAWEALKKAQQGRDYGRR